MKRVVRTSMWVVMGLYLGSLMCFAGIGCSDDGGDASGGTGGTPACAPSGDECPNACSVGTGIDGAACQVDADCQGTLFCKVLESGASSCATYEGTDYAGCTALSSTSGGSDASGQSDGATQADGAVQADGGSSGDAGGHWKKRID